MAKDSKTPEGYEFSPEQNTTIQSLSQKMKLLGVFYMVVAGIIGLWGFTVLIHSFTNALILFAGMAFFGFMGYWTHRGAGSFQTIVDTEENDISHLMRALDELRKIYNLQLWLLASVLGLVVLTIVAGLLYAGANASMVN